MTWKTRGDHIRTGGCWGPITLQWNSCHGNTVEMLSVRVFERLSRRERERLCGNNRQVDTQNQTGNILEFR